MMLALALTLAAISPGQSLSLSPDTLSAASCGTAARPCARDGDARYRLPLPTEETPATPATRAVDIDGRSCGLIGHTVCTKKPRTIIGAGEHAQESIAARLEALD